MQRVQELSNEATRQHSKWEARSFLEVSLVGYHNHLEDATPLFLSAYWQEDGFMFEAGSAESRCAANC